jgi:hypothetical protein
MQPPALRAAALLPGADGIARECIISLLKKALIQVIQKLLDATPPKS